MDPINTQKRQLQFRGPSTSDDYNTRIDENYSDLLLLKNISSLTDQQVRDSYWQLINHCVALSRTITDLETRISVLEAAKKKLTFGNVSQIDNNRFIGSSFEISAVSTNTSDAQHGVITLPLIAESSASKLAFIDTNDDVPVLPAGLELRVVPNEASVDNALATVDGTLPERAVVRSTGVVWERKILSASAPATGAALTLYVKAPTGLFTTDKSNALILHPFPLMGCDIIEVACTSAIDPVMEDADVYTPLNWSQLYSLDTEAVGFVPPGGWTGDIDLNAGMRIYHFDPKIITGLRIKLRQRNYHTHGSSYIYSYGLTDLDLRYNKFLDTGKCIIRFNAPATKTISNVTSITPKIYNVHPASLDSVFSSRVIWETSFGSNAYTTTSVPLSNRVWIEVTLRKTPDGGTPALSGLEITYT